MNPIDEFELGVFERTADIALAMEVGDVARWAVASTVEDLATTLGVVISPQAIAAYMFRGGSSSQP